ncbi:hypothetical protein GCM10022254_67960 [Actinomadura meridiana]|uniref:Death-associated protein 1 n=1 Tax=Actinomadura meridiana TaxID=559626 RepID=A0ABP8CM06_9ACTN
MAEIRVGKPHVKPDTPSHVKGVHQGNAKGGYEQEKGHHKDGTADSRRSTGVRPKRHDPILPIMPNVPPG